MSEVNSGSDISEPAAVNSDPQTGFNEFRPLRSFNTLLSDPSFVIPLEANFIIGLDIDENLFALINEINSSSNDAIIEPNPFDVGSTQKELNNLIATNKILGLIFANKVSIPGERLNNTRVGVGDSNTAGILLPLPILQNRNPISTLTIDVLETNRSFLDSYIRPWIIATSLYGLYQRAADSKQNIKLKYLTVEQFDKKRAIRKKFTFFNVVPVSMESSTLAYGIDGGKKIISTNWLFETYSITSY